jgi:hypothetical protein
MSDDNRDVDIILLSFPTALDKMGWGMRVSPTVYQFLPSTRYGGGLK